MWNPSVAILPFAAFLVLALCVAGGDIVVLPAMVLAGSFAAQAHLAYLAPVGVVAVWALVTFAVHVRRQWRSDAPDSPRAASRRQVRNVSIISAVVFIVCWWAPIAQQLGSDNPNISAIVRGGRSGRLPSAGFGFGVRLVGRVVGLPPPFGLRSMGNGATTVMSPSVADVLRFTLPWVLIAVGAVIAWRQRNRLAIAGVITAALALAAGLATAMQAPVLPGTRLVFVYNVRFLWPIAMFYWFAVVFVTWQLIGPSRPTVRKVAAGVEAVCIVVLGGVFLTQASAPRDDPGMALTRDLNRALAARVHGPGPYVIRSQGGSGFSIVSASTAVASGISVGLERRGISTYTFPDVQSSEATWGHRIYKGQPVKGTIWIVSGDSPAPTPTAQAIATANATTASERALEQSLLEQLGAAFARTGVQPTAKGDGLLGGAANDGDQDTRTQLVKAISDPAAALTDGSLATLADAQLVDVSHEDAAKLRRYEALRRLSAWRATAYIDGPPS